MHLAHEGLRQENPRAGGVAALHEARQRGDIIDAPVVAVLTSGGLKDSLDGDCAILKIAANS